MPVNEIAANQSQHVPLRLQYSRKKEPWDLYNLAFRFISFPISSSGSSPPKSFTTTCVNNNLATES